MELPKLTSQLESTNNLLRELIKELYIQKKLTNSNTPKVYIKLKRGSFQEIISIIFNHPFAISIVGGSIVAIFSKLINKTEKKTEINLENVTVNYGIMTNITNIVSPLDKKGDKLTINLPNSESITIDQSDKNMIQEKIDNLNIEEEKEFEITEEDFFGNLNSVNIKQGKFGFILEGSNSVIPASFDGNPELSEIRQILAERLKISARATKENGVIRKIEIISYEIKKTKLLKEFLNDN